MMLSDAAVVRIVDCVGDQIVPADLDHAHLRDSLNQAFARYCIDRDRHSSAATGNRSRDAKKIAKHAGELCCLLGQEQGALLMVELLRVYESDECYAGSPEFPAPLDIDSPDAPDPAILIAGLKALKVAAERVAAMDHEKGDSARRALVPRLAEIYEMHFDRKAGSSRSGAEAYGPFIRFATHFGDETQIKLKPETISRYLSTSRTMG